tara:strand:- start:129 stop:440 length:312 start_codon:yes stop_codon:yes gene_type:complete
MNKYGNQFGVHSPNKTNEVINILNDKTDIEFKDGSWHNDLCDSVYNEEYNLKIFIPNSEVDDEGNEEFNTFSVYNYDYENDEDYELLNTTDINKVIELVNKRV